MADRLGTLGWAEATRGRMRSRDKAQTLFQDLWLLLKTFPKDIRFRVLGTRDSAAPIDVAKLASPDTPGARAARAMCEELSPPFMVTHCSRTYWFSRLLGEHWGLSFDDEILYLGAFLHDISLMPGFKGRGDDEACFTLPAARAARALTAEVGWSPERQDRLAEAILLNPNAAVPMETGVEAHLLNAGVMVDAVGLRQWAFHEETLRSILDLAPRMDMKKRIVGLVDAEADAHPGTRFHFARRWFRFTHQVRRGPFEDTL